MTSIAGLRYIKPLFELAREKDLLEDVEASVIAFSKLLKESPDLESALLNPRIPRRKKKEVLLTLTEGTFPPLVRDFFCLLVDKGRERVFLFLEQEFGKLLQESRNIISATVQSPVPLPDAFKHELAQRFAETTGKTVELTEEEAPELIAGVRIMLGSRMLDGSLKARLEGMKRHLMVSARQAE